MGLLNVAGAAPIGFALQVGHGLQAVALGLGPALFGVVLPPGVPGHGGGQQRDQADQAPGQRGQHHANS